MAKKDTEKKGRDKIAFILYALYAIFLVMGVVFIVRIIQIQNFWEPDKETEKYFVPSSTRSVIEPERGAIIGCDGKLLALSTPMYQLYMDCTVRKDYFAEKKTDKDGNDLEQQWLEKAKDFAWELAGVMKDKSGDEYYSMIVEGRDKGNKYLRLGKPVDRQTLGKMQKFPLMEEGQYKSGIIVEKKDSRQYPYGSLARRTIGYVKDNRNSNGNNHIGLEGKFDYVLHGKEGEIWLRVTENKERIRDYDSTYVRPEDGLDVRTTLDINLQDIVDKALRRQIGDDQTIEMGCAVVMEVETGAIRAMVNLNRDTTTKTMNETYNMAIGMSSEPGSVFKTTTLMTALEDGYVKSLDDRIPTNNGYLPGYPQDDHVAGMKDISILHGFEISSNYVFRYLAVKNYGDNPKRFLDKLYLYKLGQAFDFDLEGLKEPFIPSPEGSLWSQTSLGSIGMGYSIQETPLHILTFYNAIANKGKMMKPYLVESLEKDGTVKKKFGPSVLNASICSRATADTLLRALKAVAAEGTGGTASRRLGKAKLQVAGKTGTSRQVLSAEEIKKYGMSNPYVTKDGSFHNLGTFVCFFPADKPKYSAIICLRSTLIKGSLYGGVLPAAAMREIVDAVHSLDPSCGKELKALAQVPRMEMEDVKPVAGEIIPDVAGLGLRDAMYIIENSGFKCSYTGEGHVESQTPRAGEKAAKGAAVQIVLK